MGCGPAPTARSSGAWRASTSGWPRNSRTLWPATGSRPGTRPCRRSTGTLSIGTSAPCPQGPRSDPGNVVTLDLSSGWSVLPWLAAALLALAWARQRGGPPVPRSRHAVLRLFRLGALAALVAIGLNPVRVAVTPGTVQRPEVHVLLDTSQSMLLGSPESRWHQGTALLRDALGRQEGHAGVRVHRFGQRLVSVDADAFLAGQELARPDDADSQLAASFRQLADRLGREAPAAVV